MAKRITHGDIASCLFSLADITIDPRSFSPRGKPGPLLELGFYWSTKYTNGLEEVFWGKAKPDGHIECKLEPIIITIEITTDSHKPKLERQLNFYTSRGYHEKIVAEKTHEIWLFITKEILDDFMRYFTSLSVQKEIDVPLIIWTVDYDTKKHQYVLERVTTEDHTPIIQKLFNDGILKNKLFADPQVFPLLSPKLSTPYVMHSIGSEFLTKSRISYKTKERKISEIFREDFRDAAVHYKYFERCVKYLSKIIPELVELQPDRTVRLKQLRDFETIDEVRAKIQKLYDLRGEKRVVIDTWIKEIEETKEKEVERKREEKEEDTAQKVMDEFMR